jgi:hypothetical protein
MLAWKYSFSCIIWSEGLNLISWFKMKRL